MVGRKFAPPPPTPPPVPRPVRFAFTGPEHVQRAAPSLVRVLFDIPYQIDGVAGLKYIGAGVVVDAKRRLVLVDRNTVPVALGVRVEFACTVEVAATRASSTPPTTSPSSSTTRGDRRRLRGLVSSRRRRSRWAGTLRRYGPRNSGAILRFCAILH